MILTANTGIKVKFSLDGNKIKKSQEIVLLGITIDDKVSFKILIQSICQTHKNKFTRVTTSRKVFKFR